MNLLKAVAFFWNLALMLGVSISCSQGQNNYVMQPQSFQAASVEALSTSGSFQITNKSGQPVPGATVLVGYEPGNPFNGNVVSTDANGQVSTPPDWKAALPVTVQAPGYITTTIPVALPGDLQISLSADESGADIEISGTPSGFGRLPSDGKVDFALIIPAMSRDNLLSFDLSAVMSPKIDTIEIFGNKIELPSNLVLPQQRETFVFPIEFNKPNFRSFVRQPGEYLVSAIHGNFPLQRVVNEIRAGKSIFEVVNHFNMIEGGQQNVDAKANVGGVNLNINQSPFNANISVQAPAFAAGKQMMSLTILEQNGLLMPTDLKRLTPSQTLNLKSGNVGARSVLSILLNEAASFQGAFEEWFKPLVNLGGGPRLFASANLPDFSNLSFTLQPVTAGTVTPQFLPMVAKPVLSGSVLTLDIPALPAGLSAVATYLALTEVEELPGGKIKNERKTRLWEVWSSAWINQVELPKIQFNRKANRKYRWEVMFMARPSNFVGTTSTLGIDLNSVSHVTRNSIDI